MGGIIYRNPEQHFGACENCGACCSIPGIFLPQEIDLLGRHLRLDRKTLFHSYLIAELFTPHVELMPVFLLSPVKALAAGGRSDKLLSDRQYSRVRNGLCVFRNSADRSCSIHAHKPFGCTLLICGRMTKAKSLMLNKTYYYHRWADAQPVLFAIFPELARLHRKLLGALSPLPAPGRGRIAALTAANDIIDIEMSELMNGRRTEEGSFYKTTNAPSA